MKTYTVISKIKHETNSEKENNNVHCSTVEANTYSEVELITLKRWAKLNCEAEIIQITLFS